MFKNIRQCLDEYEKWEEDYCNSINKHQSGTVKYLDMETSDFFELYLETIKHSILGIVN